MAKIPSNINNIVDTITKSGLAFANRYEVTFAAPSGFGSVNRDTLEHMTIRCDSITIPGRSFSTTPFRFYGPARNMPYEPIYSGELNASFVLSSDLQERKFFENWMDLICSQSNYKFDYYENYITDMEISVLTKDEINTYSVFVEEVYPKMLGDIQVGYDKDNEYMKMDVTFAYRKYSSVLGGQSKPPERNAMEKIAQSSEKFVQNPKTGEVFQVGAVPGVGPMGVPLFSTQKFDPQTAQPVIPNQRGFKSNQVR